VVGIPARIVKPKEPCGDFDAYGVPGRELPDPVSRAMDALLDQISRLQARVAVLEADQHAANGIHGGSHANGANGTTLNGTNGVNGTNGSSPHHGDALADEAASAVYELRNHI
jgi:hypothetical protein